MSVRFSVDGKIRISVLNGPGNFHYSNMADYGLYTPMEGLYDEYGAKIVVDSAFCVGEKPYPVKFL